MGKPIKGYIPTPNGHVDMEDVVQIRFSLRNAWNNNYIVQDYPSACTPFRAINNSGDPLSRKNYSCGGSCQTFQSRPNLRGLGFRFGSIQSTCDGTGIQPSACNVKFVADGSDYITFLKQKAINKNYNDISFGGDSSNASQSTKRAMRRY